MKTTTILAASIAAAIGGFMVLRKANASELPVVTEGQAPTTAPTAPSSPQLPVNSNLPRGLRNNNPLNIRFNSANKWDGQTGSDGAFCKFSSMYYGLRAAGRLMKTYRDKYQADTIGEIIARWAPQSENDTAKYINFVVMKTGIASNKVLKKEDYPTLANAMIYLENGQNPLPMAEIIKGIYAGIN